jgi:hypothetical protein
MRRGETKTINGVQAYPLAWPEHIPRRSASERSSGNFGTVEKNQNGWKTRRAMTIGRAIKRLHDEASAYTRTGRKWRIDPSQIVISSNMPTRNDGLPYASAKAPDDPGVAVYFRLDEEDQCIPIDTYDAVADNIAAVAAILGNLRSLERHGHRIVKAAFQGFKALPGGDGGTATVSVEAAASIIAAGAGAGEYTADEIISSASVARMAHRKAASRHHPDRGGDAKQMDQINRAWAELRKHHL